MVGTLSRGYGQARTMRDELETVGFALETGAVPVESLGRLLDACATTGASASFHHESGLVYGIRGLLWSSASLRPELDSSGITSLASVALGRAAFPIDAIFFDKQKDANFSVPGHQDRLMPVASGCAPASVRSSAV